MGVFWFASLGWEKLMSVGRGSIGFWLFRFAGWRASMDFSDGMAILGFGRWEMGLVSLA